MTDSTIRGLLLAISTGDKSAILILADYLEMELGHPAAKAVRSAADEEDSVEDGTDFELPVGPGSNFREMYFDVWRSRGWKEEDIQRRWVWYMARYTKDKHVRGKYMQDGTKPFAPWPDYVPRPPETPGKS